MMTGFLTDAACPHSTPPNTTTQPPPKHGFGFLCYVLDSIEELPEVQDLLEAIRQSRRNARPGYAPASMLRLFCLKFLINERFNIQLLQRLEDSPRLRQLCGLSDGNLPSESTLSRFFRHLSENKQFIETAIASMVERLRDELPGLGKVVSIDGTDIESFGNPNRNPTIDEDAAWGVRTAKNKTKRRKDTEFFNGYKLIMLADANHDVPFSYEIVPANVNESPRLRPAVLKAQATYDWLKPDYLIADKGYDSIANHKFLVERDTTPVIPIRRSKENSGLHDGIYTTRGAPTCLGGREMTYVCTDAETGKHLYQCPAEGCAKFKNKNIFVRCDDAHWENPADNLRVIGVLPRLSEQWKELYRKRQGVERYFSSAKRSRLLDKHQYLRRDKIETHVALSVLTYVATMYARIKAGDAERMRHMRIRV